MSFSLRPVNDNQHNRVLNDETPSPTRDDDRPIPMDSSPSILLPSSGRSRRPLSPSSLRDVDLSQSPEGSLRKYPTPPTGHDLMAMFPPPPPSNFPVRPTSGYFQRQERAFFAQAGKEIVRVRVEVDLNQGESMVVEDSSDHGKGNLRGGGSRTNSPTGVYNGGRRHSHSSTTTPTTTTTTTTTISPHLAPSMSPVSGHLLTPHHSPTNLHQHHQTIGLPLAVSPEEYTRDDPDESWRRPMPYAERRRAGKHTRRVIVRN